jgi:hypothetical protein
LELPARTLPTAMIIGLKDFILGSGIVILFERRLDNPRAVSYGLVWGIVVAVVAFVTWLFVCS